jgi:hypothetical protein
MTGYRRFGQRLQGHPTPVLPWVDVATGSLGQGLPRRGRHRAGRQVPGTAVVPGLGAVRRKARNAPTPSNAPPPARSPACATMTDTATAASPRGP